LSVGHIDILQRLKKNLAYNHVRMKTILLRIWKQLPLWLKIWTSRLLRPKYMVAVAAVIFNADGRILLGEHSYRKVYPWGLLAGNLEYGEDPEAAIVRELREETGFEIEVQRLLQAVSAREEHHISLIYLCKIANGSFQPTPEISAIKYFSLDDLPHLLRTEKDLILQIASQLKPENWIPV
jgi:ADP-ribose pyrophosphatase YjhB (NUDIX family)